MKPLIGIPARTLKEGDITLHGLLNTYTRALELAGAAPVLIPLGLEQDTLREILARLDGLVLAGGVDVHPREFGEPVEPFCGEIMPERDAVELPLIRWALQDKKPVLGICRGIQTMNVAAGGTLYQDIPAQIPNALTHSHRPGDAYNRRVHLIDIDPQSVLAHAVGSTRVEVNSLHHQALKAVAPGFRVIARAPDGVIEAIQSDTQFALGVQFHPEWLIEDEAMVRVFRTFIHATNNPVRQG